MFRATLCSSSGESIISIHLAYVTLCMGPSVMRVGKGRNFPTRIPNRVTYTRCCIDTIDSPDNEHKVARNMSRIEIHIYKRNYASSWLFIRIIPRCTVTRIYNFPYCCGLSDDTRTTHGSCPWKRTEVKNMFFFFLAFRLRNFYHPVFLLSHHFQQKKM